MSKTIKLHRKIRERKTPRMSAFASAEFIIAAPDRQDSLLHDQRFSSAFFTPKHQQALRVIRSYCVDIHRDSSKFEAARDALRIKSKSSGFTPSQRDEAARCVETLDLFENARNALGVGAMPFLEPPEFDKLTINGLPVSVFPDMIIGRSMPPDEGDKVGLVFIRAQKRPDPSDCKTDAKRDERSDYRREVLSYMLVLGDLALRAHGLADHQIDRKRIVGWDLRLGEAVQFPSDRITRQKRIEAACGQVARLWETIDPKPSDLA